MIKRALMMVGFVMLSACGSDEPTDAERLSSILQDVAFNTRYADKYYSENLEIFNSIKMGKPVYQAHEEMKKPVDNMRVHFGSLVNAQREEVSKIKNPAIRKSLNAGMEQLLEAYLIKFSFAQDSRQLLENLSASNIEAMTAKYEGKMEASTIQSAQALAHFMDAKEKAGLPKELTEFQ